MTVPFTLLNPHADDFIKTPVSFRLAGRRGLQKYAYLIDGPASAGRRVDVLIDGTLSSLVPQRFFAWAPLWMRRLFLRVELAVWLRINRLDGRVVVHWSPETIRDRTILYLFSYKNCVGAFQERRRAIDAFTWKVVNLSHYFILTAEKAKNIGTLDGVIYASEADLRTAAYFRKYFPADCEFVVLPFAVPSRFKVQRSTQDRAPTCAATGSFHNLFEERPKHYYADFLHFFGSSTYHPIRKSIYERQSELRDWIVCKVSPYREGGMKGRGWAKLLRRLGLDMHQKAYFSFDIVEFYNAHVFALIGEELPGLPAIGFFEAMACGCVVLGADQSCYEGVGLRSGIHYLLYDGTVDGAIRTIESARQDPAASTRVSVAARAYVEAYCRPEAIYSSLQTRLREIIPSPPQSGKAA